MRKNSRKTAAVRIARLAMLAAGAVLLAGCATGYSFVQPDVAGSGGYYTSDGSYSGQGYYDYYGTGPYYAGTSGYGYYNGTRPYGSTYGYYAPGYGYGYGPGWTFSVGVSNVWNFPGYWGPWYTTRLPSWGCYSWRCGSHVRWRHHGQHGGSWRHEGNASSPPDLTDTAQRPDRDISDRRERAMEISAWRHDHYVRSPGHGVGRPFAGVPAVPARISSRAPEEPGFASRRPFQAPTPTAMPAPRPASPAPRVTPRATFRSAPRAVPVRPAVPPSSRRSAAPATEIR